jgi:diguanylate cyclase (GGDEF)-like protein
MHHDALTGLRDRRWLMAILASLLLGDAARRAPPSIALLTVGTGDDGAIDAGLARALTRALRPTEFLVRYGERTLALLLPGMSIGRAVVTATRLRDLARTVVSPCSDAGLPAVSVCVGVVSAAPTESADELVRRAGEVLRAAQASGCSRIYAG